eukprot:CAMPEP_0195510210 /NCGR_PEP_ID=MMETSP0794_2-20130614/2921_1 /TAXON_ID=515487 /ORGANISM="Stephanopyxis turris, Strain CCMP 815" /LENGTH=557 /DNA_ID=CAMNT_0040637587 /DNA_START=195 /DNA_END=1865 /DNA_ORIENTATION=+
MPSRPNALKKSIIAGRKKMMDELCGTIFKIYTANNNTIPHRTFTNIVEEYQTLIPGLKKSMLSMAFCRYKKKREKALQQEASDQDEPTREQDETPQGSTYQKGTIDDLPLVAATTEIALENNDEYQVLADKQELTKTSQEDEFQNEAEMTMDGEAEETFVAASSTETSEELPKTSETSEETSTENPSDRKSIENENELQITAHTTRKSQSTGGRPLGSKQKKRQITIENPTLDLSGIPCNRNYVTKIRRRKPMLAAAYSELEAAKKEKENTAKTVATEEKNVEKIIAELQKAQTKLDNAKLKLERDESAIQRAVEQVEEAELNTPCRWNTNFAKLVAYKEKHGHIQLPCKGTQEDKEFHSLCLWTASQKSKYREYQTGLKKTFKPYRLKALEKLGMQWEVRCNKWPTQLNLLKEYKKTHGHCMVPTRTTKQYKLLGHWVGSQRNEWKKLKDGKQSELTPERIQMLNDVGFVWNVHDYKWQSMYEKLLIFWKEHGHCCVPDTYPTNQSLSNWVLRQRAEHAVFSGVDNAGCNSKGNLAKKCFLTPERIKLLEDIGMEW